MSEPSATAIPAAVPAPAARLEPNAIGVAQDTVIGMASAAPAAVMGLILASLALTASYGGGLTILITAIPMLIIAFAYHRLNMWNANCGASFEWVGRSINPYLGWFTGWLMIAGYVLGTISVVEVLGPAVLAVFGANAASSWGNVGIATALGLVLLIIAVVGIRFTARVQVGMAIIEYTILVGMSIWGLVTVLSHHAGTYPITSGWFSLRGVGGKGDIAGGFLIAVFAFSGWDGTVYVNEEVKHRRRNPGRAAVIAVALLAVIFIIAQVGLQGVVTPDKLQSTAASASPLTYVAQALGGAAWAKVMALSLALSSIASTGVGIVLGARIIYGMAGHRALPEFLGSVSRKYATPATSTIVFGLIVIALTWVYLLATSVQNAFTYVVNLSGIVFALFYVLTAVASLVYYRRRILAGPVNAVVLGLLPLLASVFLIWMSAKSLAAAPAPQQWSLAGIAVAGIILMLVARFVLRSPFFKIQRESDPGITARR
jgi:amino acid transporter